MEASAYLRLIYRWWWLLAAALVLGAVTAYAASSFITPSYRAAATLLVMPQQTPDGVVRSDLEASAQLAGTFRQLITIRPVLQRAIEAGALNLTVEELFDDLEVTHTRESQLIEIAATANDPARARDIAQTVASTFIASEEAQAAPLVGVVRIVEPAVAPTSPVAPQRALNAVLGSLLALVACGLLLLLRDYLDDSVHSKADIEALGFATIGQLQDFGKLSGEHQLHVAFYPQSAAAEEYRIARAALVSALGQDQTGALGRKIVLIASPRGNEGKSIIAANLAVMFGSAGYRVLLIDANTRRPALHTFFSLQNGLGLTSHLMSDATPTIHQVDITRSEAGRPVTYSNVAFISAGPSYVNAAELLASQQMRSTLNELRKQYDLVLLDTPPALEYSDATVLAAMVDAVVLVARSGTSRARDLRSAGDQLAGPHRRIDGVILNRSNGTERFAAPMLEVQPGEGSRTADNVRRVARRSPPAG